MANKLFKRYLFLGTFLIGLFGFSLTALSQSASFYLSPASGTYGSGEKFFVNLMVNVEGISINASQAVINFPTDKLEVVNLSKTGSIFTLWVEEPVYSNSKGTITLGGGLPNPGYLGSNGKILSVIFRGKGLGEATVSLSGEKILANDSHGTDIFASSKGGKYTIKKAEIVTTPEMEIPPGVVDREPPYPFEILVDNGGDPTNPSPLLYFEAKDELSGIGSYEIKIGENTFKAKPGETMPWKIPYLMAGSYQVSVKAFDKANNNRESLVGVVIESIPEPKLVTCPKVFNSGEELLYIRGTSQPLDKILINFEKDGKLIKKWEAISDENGEWLFVNDGLFKPGVYTITARAKDGRGAISNFSEPCSVNVVLNALSIGPLIISYKLFVIILVILLLLLLLFLFWLYQRSVTHKRRAERETQDLENKFFKEYYELREDVKKQLELFKKAHGRKALTIKEREAEESLLKNLKDVEDVIKKELKDIEDLH